MGALLTFLLAAVLSWSGKTVTKPEKGKTMSSLDKSRRGSSHLTSSRTDPFSDDWVEDENDLIAEEEGEEPPETYEAKWTCTNCGYEQLGEFAYGERIDSADKECRKCGCY